MCTKYCFSMWVPQQSNSLRSSWWDAFQHTSVGNIFSHTHLLVGEMRSHTHLFARCIPARICLWDMFLHVSDSDVCSRTQLLATYLLVGYVPIHIRWQYVNSHTLLGKICFCTHLLARCIPACICWHKLHSPHPAHHYLETGQHPQDWVHDYPSCMFLFGCCCCFLGWTHQAKATHFVEQNMQEWDEWVVCFSSELNINEPCALW